MIRVKTIGILLIVMTGLAVAAAGGNPLLQDPALSRTHIVFVYGGDLWQVPREGGTAVRLTSGPGVESNPVYSPDGKTIAFTGEYDGNVDVFVIPATGGVPQRLTWHPAADVVSGFTPDGKRVLFTSSRFAYSRYNELFTAGLEGGLEERLPVYRGFEGAYSPDGKRIAFVPNGRAFTAWKRYRGGRTTRIWVADLANSKIEKIPWDNTNDFNPLWAGDHIYFLSDRNGPVTLFSYHTKSKTVKQLLENNGLDLKSADIAGDTIVYEQFGKLFLLDAGSGKAKPVAVQIGGDLPELRERFVRVGDRLQNAGISPGGARAVFEARGEIITVPAEKGDFRNITATPGVMERDPAWSPDGKSIACFSDESGEYMLHVIPQDGKGEVVKISLAESPSFYFSPVWSPDSKKIAYVDCHMRLWYLDLEAKKPVQVGRDRFYGAENNLVPSWSPDSKWLAYTKRGENYLGAIFLFELETGKNFQVTDGMSDARHPVFDADGKYLYFSASTDSGASLQPDIHSISRTVSRSLYLAVLSKDDPSPFEPESDEETVTPEKAASPKEGVPPAEAKPGESKAGPAAAAEKPDAGKPPEGKPGAEKGPKPVVVKIDPEGILQRILAVPMPARLYAGLVAGKGGTLLALEAPDPLPGAAGNPGLTVHRFDLKQRRADTVLSGAGTFVMSAKGEKYLYSQRGSWFTGTLRPMPPASAMAGAPPGGGPGGGPGGTPMKTSDMEVRSVPLAEWRQMYYDAWRIQREFFYDPNLHGLDLAAAIKRYEPYLDKLSCRGDLNYLFAEMMGEVTVGHLSVFGGDLPRPERVPNGLLGADFELHQGRYRFSRIYNGENWNPQLRAPLTQPGINVKAGDYLLAVNGRDLKATDNVYRFFEGTVGKSVILTVGANPDGKDSRPVTVVPVASETALRNFAWIEDNRRYVEKATNGRVAYVYMPDTSFGGFTYFNRYFFAQVGKEAAIIDERFNAGGALATDIAEYLQRKLMSLVATRDGQDEVQPQGAIFGPKVMLINETAGSGGDAMPFYFKKAKIGPLIGTRTWGGLVGRAGAPQLMDGGIVTAPSSGVWDPDASWIAENIGIFPDIEVEQDPALVRQGKDPQLDKAIEVVMDALAKNPLPVPKRPAYPDYHKKK